MGPSPNHRSAPLLICTGETATWPTTSPWASATMETVSALARRSSRTMNCSVWSVCGAFLNASTVRRSMADASTGSSWRMVVEFMLGGRAVCASDKSYRLTAGLALPSVKRGLPDAYSHRMGMRSSCSCPAQRASHIDHVRPLWTGPGASTRSMREKLVGAIPSACPHLAQVATRGMIVCSDLLSLSIECWPKRGPASFEWLPDLGLAARKLSGRGAQALGPCTAMRPWC